MRNIGFSLLLIVGMASAQTNMGPVRTPQINQNLYVGQSGYASIQSAVTFACRTGNQSFLVVIQQGINPTDQISTVTGGCAGTYIDDYRTNRLQRYTWSGLAYTPSLPFGDGNGEYVNYVVATRGESAPINPNLPTVGITFIDAPGSIDYGRLVYVGKNSGVLGGISLTGLGRPSLYHEYLHCGPTTNFLCLFAGDVNIQGTLNAASGQVNNSPICTEASGCPGTNVTYPPAGIGVSTGSAWSANSINPAILVTTQYVSCDSTSCLVYPGNSATAGGNVFDLFPNGDLRTGVLWAYEGTIVNNNPSGYRINMRLQSGNGTAHISAPTQGLYLNDDGGNGVYFGNGNGTAYAMVDTSGNFTGRSVGWSTPQLPDGTDLNTVTQCGNWGVNLPVNKPPIPGNWVGIQNICFVQGNLLQISYEADDWGWSDPSFYFRKLVNNTWGTGWYRVVGTAAGSFTNPILPEPSATEKRHILEAAKAPKPLGPNQATAAVQAKTGTPKTSKGECSADSIWHDQNYLYVCIASGNIKRVALNRF